MEMKKLEPVPVSAQFLCLQLVGAGAPGEQGPLPPHIIESRASVPSELDNK